MLLFRAALVSAFVGLGACTATGSDRSVMQAKISAETLPFPGETSLVFIEQKSPDQTIAIVKSCAPLTAGCKSPQVKARSIKHAAQQSDSWEFADLKNCPGAQTLVTALLTTADKTPLTITYTAGPHLVKSAKQHAAEDLVARLSSCLSKSYMTPPWERSP